MMCFFSFKGVKHGELLFGRNKLLSLIVGKSQTSRTRGIILFIFLITIKLICCVCLVYLLGKTVPDIEIHTVQN